MDGSSKSTVKQDLINRIFDTMEYGPAPESDAAANEWLDKHQRRFGQLIDAQALGDVRSLADHGLPVLRVHLGNDPDAGLTRLTALIERVLAVR